MDVQTIAKFLRSKALILFVLIEVVQRNCVCCAVNYLLQLSFSLFDQPTALTAVRVYIKEQAGVFLANLDHGFRAVFLVEMAVDPCP